MLGFLYNPAARLIIGCLLVLILAQNSGTAMLRSVPGCSLVGGMLESTLSAISKWATGAHVSITGVRPDDARAAENLAAGTESIRLIFSRLIPTAELDKVPIHYHLLTVCKGQAVAVIASLTE